MVVIYVFSNMKCQGLEKLLLDLQQIPRRSLARELLSMIFQNKNVLKQSLWEVVLVEISQILMHQRGVDKEKLSFWSPGIVVEQQEEPWRGHRNMLCLASTDVQPHKSNSAATISSYPIPVVGNCENRITNDRK